MLVKSMFLHPFNVYDTSVKSIFTPSYLFLPRKRTAELPPGW